MSLLLHGAEWVWFGSYFCPFSKFPTYYTESPIIYSLLICFFGPLFEELICRKILLQKMREFLPDAVAIIISTGVFTILHDQYWVDGLKVGSVISIYISGIFFAYLFLWRSSFRDSFYVHSLVNILGIVSVPIALNLHIPCVAISIYSLGLLIFLNLLLIGLTLVLLIKYDGDMSSFSGAIKDKGLGLLAKFSQ